MKLTDEERAFFAERLGPGARVEVWPADDPDTKDRRSCILYGKCTVGDWSKMLVVHSLHRLNEPGEVRAGALKMLAFGFRDAAPHLFPAAA